MAFAGEYVVKFAWSDAARQLLLDQDRLLRAMPRLRVPIPVPVAISEDPPLLVYRKMPGQALSWTARVSADSTIVRAIGRQLGELLADLHAPSLLERLVSAGIRLQRPVAQSTPDALRQRMFAMLDPRRLKQAEALVDVVEERLSAASATTFLHGDLHGHNLLVSDDTRGVIGLLDFEESGAGDPAYDFRYLPALGPTLELLSAAMKTYAHESGHPLELGRVLAWHVLTDLGDALWRTEQGADVVDGPLTRRFDDLLIRLQRAGW